MQMSTILCIAVIVLCMLIFVKATKGLLKGIMLVAALVAIIVYVLPKYIS